MKCMVTPGTIGVLIYNLFEDIIAGIKYIMND